MAQLVKSIFSGLTGWGSTSTSASVSGSEEKDDKESKGVESEEKASNTANGAEEQTQQKHPEATRAVEHRDYDISELQQFDGSVPDVAILIAIRGKIFDVSSRADLYGIGGAYSWMAGKEASRMLAKMTKDPAEQENHDLSDLTEKEMKVLEEWEKFFAKKYDIVGSVIQPYSASSRPKGEDE